MQRNDITVILDRSSSMQSCIEPTINSFNKFLKEQANTKGVQETVWSLVLFDSPDFEDGYKVIYSQIPEKELPELNKNTYIPRGSTALLHAIGKTIDDTGSRLHATPPESRPDKVLIIIITDGLENTPNGYTRKQVFDMIGHQREKYNWTFMFLGAEQKAIAVAATYNIPSGSSCTYSVKTSGSIATAFAGINRSTQKWKTGTTEDNLFTLEEQKEIENAK